MNYKKKLESIVTQFAKRHDLQLNGTFFYNKKEWNARGEPYGNRAVASLTTEDELYDILNGNEPWDWRPHDELIQELLDSGFLTELGYAWSLHCYLP